METCYAAPCLASVPEELLIHVLLQLGIRDLCVCKQVCHRLAATISSAVALCHRIQLAAHGMIHGPDCRESLSVCVDKLQQYDCMWFSAGPVFRPLSPSSATAVRRLTNTSGVLAFIVDSDLRICRTPSGLAGIPEWTSVLTHCLENIDVATIACYAVDPGQDLVVISTAGIGNVPPKCYFFSLSQDGEFHPLAHTSWIETRQRDTYTRAVAHTYRVEVVGDLVAWSMRSQYEVWDWRTGVCLYSWRPCRTPLHTQVHLLSRQHIVLVNADGLWVSRFDRGNLEALRDPIRDSVCLLQFPVTHKIPYPIVVSSHLGRPGSFPDCAPVFQHDPASAVLAVNLRILRDCSMHVESYVFVVPLTTILEHLPAVPAIPGHQTVLPWDEWGPKGTRVLKLQPPGGSISVYGSRCAVVSGSDETGTRDVTIFDVHPGASLAQAPREAERKARAVGISASDTIDGKVFLEPVRSTMPYRVLHKEVFVGQTNRELFSLTHSGMAFLLDHDPTGDVDSCGGLYSVSV